MSSISTHELLAEIDKNVTEKLGRWSCVTLYKNVAVTVVRPPSRVYGHVDLNSRQARLWLKLNNAISERPYEEVLRESNLTTRIERTQYRHSIIRPGKFVDIVFDENGLPILEPEKIIEIKRKADAYSRITALLEELRGKEAYVLKYLPQPNTPSLLEYIPKEPFKQLTLEEAFRLKNRKLPSWGPKSRIEKRRSVRPDLNYIFPETGCNMEAEIKPSSQIWSPVENLRKQLEMYWLSNVFKGFERNGLGIVEPVIPTRREQNMFAEFQETIEKESDMTFLPQCISTPERIDKSAKARLRYLEKKKEEVTMALEEAKEKGLQDSIKEFSRQLKIIQDEEEESKNISNIVPKLFED